MIHYKQKMLEEGKEFVTSEKGHSMTPLLLSGQRHKLTPIKIEEVKVGDIVFCKVNGNYYTHLVKAVGSKGVQIGNNHGRINGWTRMVYGKVTEIL